MAGWIKVYRDLADHWLSQDLQKLGWWAILLLKVNHEDKRVLVGSQVIELKRGQIIASFSYLAELWKTSKRTAERFIELLEREKMVSRCVSRKVTILTICNWDSYQGIDSARCVDNCVDDEPMVSQSVAETKNEEERKEIINKTNSAYTREEKVSWNASAEKGFCERFKAQGYGMKAARVTGLRADEILSLLDAFTAKCEMRNQGHRDFDHFNNRFLWAIQNKWIQLPAAPKEKKSGRNILEAYGL